MGSWRLPHLCFILALTVPMTKLLRGLFFFLFSLDVNVFSVASTEVQSTYSEIFLMWRSSVSTRGKSYIWWVCMKCWDSSRDFFKWPVRHQKKIWTETILSWNGLYKTSCTPHRETILNSAVNRDICKTQAVPASEYSVWRGHWNTHGAYQEVSHPLFSFAALLLHFQCWREAESPCLSWLWARVWEPPGCCRNGGAMLPRNHGPAHLSWGKVTRGANRAPVHCEIHWLIAEVFSCRAMCPQWDHYGREQHSVAGAQPVEPVLSLGGVHHVWVQAWVPEAVPDREIQSTVPGWSHHISSVWR